MHHRCLFSLLILCLSLVASTPTHAQDQVSDQDRIKALEQQNRELSEQLAQKLQEIERLKSQIQDLRKRLAPGLEAPAQDARPATTGQEEQSIDSFSTLRLLLENDYFNDMRDTPWPEGSGREVRTQQNAYLKALNRWISLMNRKWQQKIRWPVILQDARGRGKSLSCTVIALDPVDARPLGEPFSITLDDRMARRFSAQGGLRVGQEYILTGMLNPRVYYDQERPEPVVEGFDRKFLGRFVCFNPSITVQSFSLWNKESSSDEDG